MYDLTDCSETPILEMLDEETPIVEMLDDMDDPRDTNTEMTLIDIADDSQDAPNIEHRAKESCPEVCWLCEEYDQECLPSTGVGCCLKAKEPAHEEHICRDCHAETNRRMTPIMVADDRLAGSNR